MPLYKRLLLSITCLLIVPAVSQAAELQLPAQPGQSLTLAPDDYRLQLAQSRTWEFSAPALDGHQVVLNFRARIDSPATIGSANLLQIELNGQVVGLRTARRQIRLLNKPNRFPWSDPPSLNWYIPPGQWRLVYAPDFNILTRTRYYNAESYHFVLDVSDLVKPGDNSLVFKNTGNAAIAAHAHCKLDLVFRDLKLEVRPGPGVLPGAPPRPDPHRPFICGVKRSAPFHLQARGGNLLLQVGDHSYELSSRFSTPGKDGHIEWLPMRQDTEQGSVQAPGYHVARRLTAQPDRGRLLITDTFTSTSSQPVAIRFRHSLHLLDGRAERVSFGGREDPNLDEINLPETPYLFLPRQRQSVGVVAYDDVLRTQAWLYYDDAQQTGGLRDDWFGLLPGATYQMTWAVYATASSNVFDLVNLVRRDWGVSFPLKGGLNFFDPDQILAYDDAQLKQHLDRLNINITMSQGGWVDRQLLAKGVKNIGHGPIVASDFYASYRQRLRAACQKLHRLRPGIKCLIYYDPWLAAGKDIAQKYADSFYTGANGKPRMYEPKTPFGFPLGSFTPTLTDTLGKEILAKIPEMILDEIGGDGLYCDEMIHGFTGSADYLHPDGHTFLSDPQTGKIIKAVGASELAAQGFKLAFVKAFLNRGATVVGNGPPATMTEQKLHFIRFTENDIPNHAPIEQRTWLYTPVCYAGWSTYHKPGVTEQDFLNDIRNKLWQANLYLFSAPMFYHLFTHENLATYEYPITVQELDWGVIIGRERIITLRSGKFGWPGEKWSGELLRFDASQHVISRQPVKPGQNGCIDLKLARDQAAVIVRH